MTDELSRKRLFIDKHIYKRDNEMKQHTMHEVG